MSSLVVLSYAYPGPPARLPVRIFASMSNSPLGFYSPPDYPRVIYVLLRVIKGPPHRYHTVGGLVYHRKYINRNC